MTQAHDRGNLHFVLFLLEVVQAKALSELLG